MTELKKLNLNPQEVLPEVKIPEAVKAVAREMPPLPQVSTEGVKVHQGQKWLMIAVAIVLGVGSGYGLFKLAPANPQTAGVSKKGELTAGIKVGDVYGNADEKTFRDSAEGVIERGTESGEGSHSLLRPGGPSKTANLTSSIIDLDQFVGHRVEIWGETFSAQKSGWLMDVGRIKVLELNAPKPE